MKQIVKVVLAVFIFSIGCQRQIKIPENAMSKFVEFKSKEKFAEEIRLPYPGISDPKLKASLTEKINQAAKRIAEKGKATDNEYQNVIKKGHGRFSTLYARLDTEDRERICSYFEELMDIVGLESSDGQLNTFIYDFDPTQK